MNIVTIIALAISCGLLAYAGYTDYRWYKISNKISFTLYGVGLAYIIWYNIQCGFQLFWVLNVLASHAVALLMFYWPAISAWFKSLKKGAPKYNPEAVVYDFGGGDSKLIMAMSLFYQPVPFYIWLLAATLIAGVMIWPKQRKYYRNPTEWRKNEKAAFNALSKEDRDHRRDDQGRPIIRSAPSVPYAFGMAISGVITAIAVICNMLTV